VSTLRTLQRRGVLLAAAVVPLAAGGCGDLLQEPDTGIATMLTLTSVSGDEQTGAPGQPLSQPLRVRVSNLQGGSTDRLAVEWVVVSGSGRVEPRYSFTDADGIAEATWTLGATAGVQRIEARFADEVEVFEAEAVP
jgi:hypothetical protein